MSNHSLYQEKKSINLKALSDTNGLFQVLAIEPKNIEASKIKILQMVCRGSQYQDAAIALRKMFVELERCEPTNAGQFIANARLFSRICGRDPHVLEATAMFAEKAATLESTSAVAMAEVGHQCLLRNKFKDAQRYYKVHIYLQIVALDNTTFFVDCNQAG